MTVDPSSRRPGRRLIGSAQVLLVVAAGALWASTRLPWVVVRSFDGLSPPKEVALSGGAWSTALLPLAVLLLAAAVAALAVRGWPLRALAALLALVSLAVGYLGVSLWVVPDVAVRGAELAHVTVMSLVGSERRHWGAGVAVAAAAGVLIAAVLLMRAAGDRGSARVSAERYAAPATRRSIARQDRTEAGADEPGTADLSERMIWDALDEGRDPTREPTDPSHRSDTEGR